MSDVALILSSLLQVLNQVNEWALAVQKAHNEGRTLSDAERDAFRQKALDVIARM